MPVVASDACVRSTVPPAEPSRSGLSRLGQSRLIVHVRACCASVKGWYTTTVCAGPPATDSAVEASEHGWL